MVSGAQQTVTVEANGTDLLENVPYAHNDVDISSLSKLSVSSPGAAGHSMNFTKLYRNAALTWYSDGG